MKRPRRPESNRNMCGAAALVTGSAKGMGSHIARRLGSAGAAVGVHYRTSQEAALQLQAEIAAAGGRAEVFQADLSDPAAARALVARAADTFGRLDYLIYNVGPFLTTPFTRLDDAAWDEIITANLKSAWAAETAAAAWLCKSGGGHIINIAANSAYVRTHSVYGLAKAALIHLTESLAVELGPEVRVNCLAPGMVEGSEPDPKTRELVLERTPLQRLVTAGEIAEICWLLCSSPAFLSVTGRTIVMDGGRWLR